MRPSRLLLVAGVAIVVFALDRVTKAWVSENIPLGTTRPIIGDYVRIVHAQNTGAAFGLLPERTALLIKALSLRVCSTSTACSSLISASRTSAVPIRTLTSGRSSWS